MHCDVKQLLTTVDYFPITAPFGHWLSSPFTICGYVYHLKHALNKFLSTLSFKLFPFPSLSLILSLAVNKARPDDFP